MRIMQQMGKTLKDYALRLQAARATAEEEQAKLVEHINSLCEDRGSALEMAKRLEVSAQHMSDIRAGRRGISDALLSRIRLAAYPAPKKGAK